MNWIKNTGSPSTGHPFSSLLNPEAVEFVPRQGNSEQAEESTHPIVPPPFPEPESTIEDTRPDYRTIVANNFSQNALPCQQYITQQPFTTDVYQENNAHSPESYYVEENSPNQNDVEDCQTVVEIPKQELPNENAIIHSNDPISTPSNEEQRHYSSEPHNDPNFRYRNNFGGRGNSRYSDRRGGRGSFRGRHPSGRYFNDNQYHRSESGRHDYNNVHPSSNKSQINEESSYEQHSRDTCESSSRTGWDTQGPRQQEQNWREKINRHDQPYRDNERDNRRRYDNDKPRRDNSSAERDWYNSRGPRDTAHNRGRRGAYPRSRGSNQWRGKYDGPKFDKSRNGGRPDRRNTNSSEDERKISYDESSWDSSHITDDDSNNAWDLHENQNNDPQPALTKTENVENNNSWSDAVESEISQISSAVHILEEQDQNTSTNYRNDDNKEPFNKQSKFHNKFRTSPNYDKAKQEQVRHFSHSDEDETKDLREGTNLMSEDASRRSKISPDSKSHAEEGHSKRDNWERSQGSSRTRGVGRGRTNFGPKRDEPNWREKRNRDDEPRGNNQRQNRQRTFSNDKRERENNPASTSRVKRDWDNSRDYNQGVDGRVGRRGIHSDQRRGQFDKTRNEGRQDRLSPGNNGQKDVDCSADDLKITNDESSSDNYHITDDDSNNAWNAGDLPKSVNIENSNSGNDDFDIESNSSVTNTLLETQEIYNSANDDTKETSHKSPKFNNKSDWEDKPKAKDPIKQSDDNERKPFAVKKNENVAERFKELKKFTANQKYIDPRMEREMLNKSCGSVVLEEENDRKKNSHPDGNHNKQRRITSYFEPSGDRELWDKEFDVWEKRWESIKEFKRVDEVAGDLFEQPKEYSLAHCVAEDLRMGSGIAVAFKREFKNLPDLLDQKARQGGLATLHDEPNNRYVYYLVTKRESTGKPTYFTLWKSLCKMRDHVKKNEVKKIAIPRLACGLDRLEWDKVKSMLESLFQDVDVELRVCNFQQNELMEEKKSKAKLVVEEFPVTKIAAGTLILYLATSDGEQDDIITNLSKKFDFWPSFQTSESKNLGDIVYYDDKGQNFGLCGCIVRRTSEEEISFKTLHVCIQNVNKLNQRFGNDMFEYVAFQWVDEKAYYDELINQKIITLLIGFLRNVDVYVCRGSFGDEGE